MRAEQIVEAVLFASDAPLKAEEIARADETLNEDLVQQALEALGREYQESERSFTIVELGEGYQILTRPEFASYLERFDTVPRPSRLSGPALETLAIIAYREPIGRLEIEYIRGVGSSGVLRTLLDRGIVEVVGRGEGLGRPLLYGTTRTFLEHFGFKSLDDLPRPEELPVVLRDRPPLGMDGEDEEEQVDHSVSEDESGGGDEVAAEDVSPSSTDVANPGAEPEAEAHGAESEFEDVGARSEVEDDPSAANDLARDTENV